MTTANTSITIIQSSNFKWTAQVQYFESLSTRDEAIRYASEHNCNLVVEYNRRSGPKFDALLDPNMVCTSEGSCKAAEMVPVVAEPEPVGWSKLMLRGVFGFVKRLGAAKTTSHGEKAMASAHS